MTYYELILYNCPLLKNELDLVLPSRGNTGLNAVIPVLGRYSWTLYSYISASIRFAGTPQGSAFWREVAGSYILIYPKFPTGV